ncbi:hypothetical protein [Sinorhizobium meliloti]|uniref:hypothetical protein n=1 Tax=Rhizobium meliloti TaxID=382 RepID=UPI001297EC98|nr:hypothetical protein [Sinorhizobium meliloti]MQW55661.1 hypothetical protein [Sinorhizobium meliloti]
MKTLIACLTLSLISGPTFAACYGTDAFSTCNDSSGNRYTIQRYGNTTYMQGNNYRTGSRWSQNSTTYGNTTFHNGRDAEGNSWRSTTYDW